MIKTFADQPTQQLYLTGTARRVPPNVASRAACKLAQVGAAARVEDLKVPPGNRLHALEAKLQGHFSVSFTDQWRIGFRLEEGDANDVERCDDHAR